MLFEITCEAYPSLTHQSWKTIVQSLQGPLKLWESFLVLEVRDNSTFDKIVFPKLFYPTDYYLFAYRMGKKNPSGMVSFLAKRIGDIIWG